jgi:uncharacterized glyoxalase superfamily protein PhnB
MGSRGWGAANKSSSGNSGKRSAGPHDEVVIVGGHTHPLEAFGHFGNGMSMLGSARDDDFGKLQKPPRALGGVGSQSPYIIVEDADKRYARAVTAGAEIVMQIEDEDYGGRGYACRDPEGHLWNFGTYDPWAATEPV